jgi:hypothetical protein
MRWWGRFLTLALLTWAVLLSAANGLSQQPRHDDKHQAKSAQQNESAKTQPAELSPSLGFEAPILESLRAIRNEQEAYRRQQHADNKDWDTPSFWINVALAIVGVAYTIFACLQWRTIHRQADIAEHALYRVQAASLHARSSARKGDDAVTVVVHNYGPTPGFLYDISIRAGFFKTVPLDNGDKVQYAESNKYGPGLPIFPDKEQTFIGRVEDELGASSKGFFLIYGYFIYEDVFGRRFKRGFGILFDEGRFARIPSKVLNYEYEIKAEQQQPRDRPAWRFWSRR